MNAEANAPLEPLEQEAKERSTCSACLARTYRGEECVCEDGGDAEDFDVVVSDQIRISDSGELETVPTTWDGEPLYSPSTVAEGLFRAGAFEQVPGQTSMSNDVSGTDSCWS